MLRATLIVFSLASGACTAKRAEPESAGSSAVQLSERAPPAGYVKLKELSVQSGKGCGLLAERGDMADAERKLRDAAAKLGASYVQVTSIRKPGANHQCLEHEYALHGVAYRNSAPAPAAAPAAGTRSTTAPEEPPAPPAAASATLQPGSPRACIPGITQACLGAGACQGAQACRDDGAGFSACDCGSARSQPLE